MEMKEHKVQAVLAFSRRKQAHGMGYAQGGTSGYCLSGQTEKSGLLHGEEYSSLTKLDGTSRNG